MLQKDRRMKTHWKCLAPRRGDQSFAFEKAAVNISSAGDPRRLICTDNAIEEFIRQLRKTRRS